MTAAIVALVIVTMGGSALFLWYAEFRVLKDGAAQLGQKIPGARRRAILSLIGFIGFIAVEVGLWFLGKAIGGPALGGALVVAGIIGCFIIGVIAGIGDDARRRQSSS